MAFASSRIEAQEAIIRQCDLCEDDENVNWYCKDCVQNMCDRCKKGHLKTTNCKNHNLVSILEGVTITKKNVTNLCQDHEEPFLLFCRSCQKNICTKCFFKVHKKHDFIDIHELHSELQRKLDDVLKTKEDEKEKITQNLDALVEYERVCGKALKQSYENIDDMVISIQLHVAAAEEGQNLKKLIKTSTDGRLTEVRENQRKLEAKKNAYDEEIQAVRREFTLQSPSTLNHFVKTSKSKLQTLKPITFSVPQIITFTVGGVDKELIQDMIGKDGSALEVSNQPEIVKKVENGILPKLKIVHTYNMSVKDCYSICTNPDSRLWIGGGSYGYHMNSNCFTVLDQIPTRRFLFALSCRYIACLQSGDAVVSYGGASCIDRFTSDGRRVVFADLSPRQTFNIAVTNHGEVAVSVREDNLFSECKSSIFILSRNGKPFKEIKMDTTNILRFCIDKNGNFVTSDGESPCLTTFDQEGVFLKKTQITKHNIRLMTCDNHGNVLVVFNDEKEVHLISDDGKVERSLIIKCDREINGICIDRESRLLILVDKSKVVVAKYKELQ